jgi:hypothetical protein
MPIVREEGKYYVWTAELTTIGQEAPLFSDYYNSTKMEMGRQKNIFLENLLIRQ